MVDSIPQHGEFHLGLDMKYSQPFLAFVESAIEIQLVQPILSYLPFLADLTHRVFHFLSAFQSVQDVVTVGLREKIIDHTVTYMFAMCTVILAENGLHGGPYLVDHLEVFLRRQLGADAYRAL